MTSSPRSPRTTSISLAVAWTLCVTLTFVYADEPRQYFNLLPLASAENVQLPVDESNPQRLLDLLQVKAALYDRVPTGSDPDNIDLDNSSQLGVTKRVFCNGFTGCGGRFRLRRRQKRPFCNTYGCYNSGKKRANEVESETRDDAPELGPQAADEGWTGEKFKKLFCNGYGGCQNMGKRVRIGDEQGSPREQLLPLPEDEREKLKKRVWSGNLDDEMEGLADKMGR